MPATKPQDQIIETLETIQARVLETNARIAAELNERMPSQVSERIATMPRPDLPQPAEAIEICFDFVERVTENGRKFATDLVNVWDTDSNAETAPAAPAKKPAAKAKASVKKAAAAKKPAAKKAATKKSAAKKPAAK